MNSFKKIVFITILFLLSGNVFADNHSTNTELVEKAKEITKEIESKQSQVDEDEVPLNDPFAGNEGMGSSTVNPENGKSEAKKAGQLIKQENIKIDLYYSSFQLRAKNTLKIIQEELKDFKKVISAWELNERHYGALTGLNKDEMKVKLGEEKVHQFRRSWDLRPDPLDKKNPYHPLNIETYKEIPLEKIPDTESLKDTYERVIKFYSKEIEHKTSENILISAHGNSIRALCKHLFNLDDNKISKLEIPTGNPLLIELENSKISNCKYLDQERAKDLLVY